MKIKLLLTAIMAGVLFTIPSFALTAQNQEKINSEHADSLQRDLLFLKFEDMPGEPKEVSLGGDGSDTLGDISLERNHQQGTDTKGSGFSDSLDVSSLSTEELANQVKLQRVGRNPQTGATIKAVTLQDSQPKKKRESSEGVPKRRHFEKLPLEDIPLDPIDETDPCPTIDACN